MKRKKKKKPLCEHYCLRNRRVDRRIISKTASPPELSQCTSVDAEWRILEEIIIIFLVRAFAAFEPPCNREIHIILTGLL